MYPIIKKRKIKVIGMTCENCEKKIHDALVKFQGMNKVEVDKNGIVHVEYDLMKIKLMDIEKRIEGLGYKISNKMMDKIKRGFVHDTEKNEYDNMMTPASPCCSNPDKILNRK